MRQRLSDRISARLEGMLPEQRLYLKSDEGTRFVRLRPGTQAGLLVGGAVLVGWSVVVTAFFIIDGIAAGSGRDQAARAQIAYEHRLEALSGERDARATEAEQALSRFYTALDEVSEMQEALLASEQRVRELETGIEVIQRTLRRTVGERDAAREETRVALARLEDAPEAAANAQARREDAEETLNAIITALESTAQERDKALVFAEAADAEIERMEVAAALMAERNDRIFSRLEQAMETSLTPLRRVFERAGVSTDSIIDQVRQGYAGTGGPIEPLVVSTRGDASARIDRDTARANSLLDQMEEIDLHRIVAESLPLDHPVRGSYKRTSGFGPRWGRMHSGVDFAAARGTPIHATAAGTVTHAGWQSGYGKLIKIRHPFGFETRYAHLNRIRVAEGQRVSRGERIGDMGTTGRSTGVHLHYEIRRGGTALDPATFISAGRDVF
ncbi:M23 family metallopeptidase [Jannaschia aquimarina]|uniref:MepM protein n=1 Tax=Jannaschia aquimarina TaxID=935700 RepID=A0A0D1EJL7_9RHOB|nr:M23 family metallopeptidase [Jannaschia aquimarina]KIT17181.1 Murein DD-endopeptidase MepM [Jannaschia aquimarina]SNT17933.1 Peptidase family M23 [Jannaschia aquimarina]